MKNLLKKECRLAALPLTYFFLAFGFMALLPGYPILLTAFFVCLGLFQSFQTAREANDLLYTALLPIRKADAVKGRMLFCAFIELTAFAVSAVCTLVRMTALKDAAVYRQNALMNANFVYLGFLLLIYGCFNAVFVRGFFKTGGGLMKPFLTFGALAFLIVAVGEALHFIPVLSAANAFGFDRPGLQVACLAAGAGLFALLTFAAEKSAEKAFEKVDL